MASAGATHSVDVNVGHRIRIRRSSLGMSQARLGELIGVTFQQVQKYEGAKNRISASTLALAATALDVPISYFFQGLQSLGSRDESAERALIEFIASADGGEIARAFTRIAPRHRRALVDLVKAMGEKNDHVMGGRLSAGKAID